MASAPVSSVLRVCNDFDLLEIIFSHLDFVSMKTASHVCK